MTTIPNRRCRSERFQNRWQIFNFYLKSFRYGDDIPGSQQRSE